MYLVRVCLYPSTIKNGVLVFVLCFGLCFCVPFSLRSYIVRFDFIL